MKKKQQPIEEWEKEFDKTYDLDAPDKPIYPPHCTQNDVKSFIRSELKKAKQEGREEAIERIEKEFMNLLPAFPNKKTIESLRVWNTVYRKAKEKVLSPLKKGDI